MAAGISDGTASVHDAAGGRVRGGEPEARLCPRVVPVHHTSLRNRAGCAVDRAQLRVSAARGGFNACVHHNAHLGVLRRVPVRAVRSDRVPSPVAKQKPVREVAFRGPGGVASRRVCVPRQRRGGDAGAVLPGAGAAGGCTRFPGSVCAPCSP